MWTAATSWCGVFEEIVKLGEANVRRIYGDFSGTRLAGWNKEIQSLAILQHQQRSNTTGKNASDIALVIDAMDLMHKGKLDGFCLVSSDSDFTRLAQRLREDGLVVYGFGERKTPEAFRSACNRFIYVDNLMEDGADRENDEAASPAAAKKEPPSKAVKIIARAIEDSDDDGWANLGGVGRRGCLHDAVSLGSVVASGGNILPDIHPPLYSRPGSTSRGRKARRFRVAVASAAAESCVDRQTAVLLIHESHPAMSARYGMGWVRAAL